jgi:hypothetical protein
MGLLLWIAERVREVKEPNTYVDDNFGWDRELNMVEYTLFQRLMPVNQQKFLTLLDDLGVPHKPQKQIHGPVLKIISLLVDTNNLTITLAPEKKWALLEELDRFIICPGTTKWPRFPLREWHQLAGWMNWAFNIFPLLQLGLSNLYAKMAGLKDFDC